MAENQNVQERERMGFLATIGISSVVAVLLVAVLYFAGFAVDDSFWKTLGVFAVPLLIVWFWQFLSERTFVQRLVISFALIWLTVTFVWPISQKRFFTPQQTHAIKRLAGLYLDPEQYDCATLRRAEEEQLRNEVAQLYQLASKPPQGFTSAMIAQSIAQREATLNTIAMAREECKTKKGAPPAKAPSDNPWVLWLFFWIMVGTAILALGAGKESRAKKSLWSIAVGCGITTLAIWVIVGTGAELWQPLKEIAQGQQVVKIDKGQLEKIQWTFPPRTRAGWIHFGVWAFFGLMLFLHILTRIHIPGKGLFVGIRTAILWLAVLIPMDYMFGKPFWLFLSRIMGKALS
ncbi:MAG: hypothetical protein G01um101466_84 [Parcubacteria group bacterium Gr01-1014_66]|nr:MAG: hypothetical protein G01um101466_84 [Parcubacteria group bacterium Gr01-1014_66]